jgi:hypothetical protein
MTTVAAVIAAVFATIIAAVVAIPVTITIAVAIAAIVVTMAMALLVTGDVFTLIPAVTDKIDAFAAGAVFMAMLAPMLGMARRDAQVKRRAAHRHRLDHDGLRIEQGRGGKAADIQATVEARLADADRDLGRSGSDVEGESGKQRCCEKAA